MQKNANSVVEDCTAVGPIFDCTRDKPTKQRK